MLTKNLFKNQRLHSDVPGWPKYTPHAKYFFLFDARRDVWGPDLMCCVPEALIEPHIDVIGWLFVPSIWSHAKNPKADLVT